MKYVFSYLDLWPYIIISIIFILCSVKRFKYSSLIIYFTLFVFCALRYDIGWDYMSYIKDLEEGPEAILNSRYEFLSKCVFYIGSYLDFYPLVFILFSFFTLSIIYKSIKFYSFNPVVSWVVYYSLPLFFLSSLSTIRQSLATVLVFYSYHFVKNKKYFLFLITLFVASLFHISAIIGVFILPLVLSPMTRLKNLILFVSSFFVSTLIYGYLVNLDASISSITRLQSYILNDENVRPNKIIYVYYAIGTFNILFFDKLIRFNERNKDFITLFNFGLIMLNLLSFEPISSLRISAFFMLFIIYIIPYYPSLFKATERSLVQFIIIFGLIGLSFFYIFLYVKSYNENLLEKVSFLPYRIWFL